MGKTLSISVASYNVEKTLAETLDSLLVEAVLNEIEIIVVNDGSSDSTEIIAEKYQKLYPQTFKVVNKENGGHGSTINAALKIASGKYFKVVDGDDWVDEKGLVRLVEYLKKTNVDLILSEYVTICENNGRKTLCNYGKYNDGIIRKVEDVLQFRGMVMHEITIKTELLRDNAPPITENCFYVDREFMQYCVGYSETIAELPFPVYLYRVGNQGQSVSPENRYKRLRDQGRVLFKLLKWRYKKNNILSKTKVKFLNNDSLKLIRYIIDSHCFTPEHKYAYERKRIEKLLTQIRSNFPQFECDTKSIMFSVWKDASITSKVLKIIEFVTYKLDFKLYAKLQVMKVSLFTRRK